MCARTEFSKTPTPSPNAIPRRSCASGFPGSPGRGRRSWWHGRCSPGSRYAAPLQSRQGTGWTICQGSGGAPALPRFPRSPTAPLRRMTVRAPMVLAASVGIRPPMRELPRPGLAPGPLRALPRPLRPGRSRVARARPGHRPATGAEAARPVAGCPLVPVAQRDGPKAVSVEVEKRSSRTAASAISPCDATEPRALWRGARWLRTRRRPYCPARHRALPGSAGRRRLP